MPNRFVCPICKGTDLMSEAIELTRFVNHIVDGNFISEKRIPIEMEKWTIYCNNTSCKNSSGFPESDLNDYEEIGENLDD